MPRVISLDKSLSLLEAVLRSKEGIGTRALQQKLGYNVATIHNIAMTFCARGYLRQDPESRHFSPGMRLMLVGRHPGYLRALTASAAPIADEVALRLNESVLLASTDHGRVINLKYIPSRQALRVQEPEDLSDHAYCTAFGKVLLASLSEPELEAYLRETRLEQFTPNTIAEPSALRRELQKVRQLGYAETHDEYCEGVSAVAVPIHDPWGSIIASIGASAPSLRMRKVGEFEKSLQGLRNAAAQIEHIWSQQRRSEPVKKRGVRKKKSS